MTEDQGFFPWDEIPDQDVLPSGDYHVHGEALEDGKASTGKRMFKGQIVVDEPALYASMALFENYVTGNDEKPTGIIPGTMGTRQLKKMLSAAQVPASNDIAKLCTGFKGTLFGVSVVEFEEKEGEYVGTPRNRITRYWKRGERTPGVKVGGAATGGKGPAAAASAAAAAVGAPPAPTAGPAPATTVTNIVQAPATPAEQAAPAAPAAPIDVPAGAPPAPAAPITDGSAPTAAPALGDMMECPLCKKMVSAVDFAAHVQQCAAKMGEQ